MEGTKAVRKKWTDRIGANLPKRWENNMKKYFTAEIFAFFMDEGVSVTTLADDLLTGQYKLEEQAAIDVATAVVASLQEWQLELKMLRLFYRY